MAQPLSDSNEVQVMMDHLPYISAFGERFVSRCTLTFLVAAMLTSGLAGCLEASNQEEGLNLVVVYEATNGTVYETYEGGEQTSLQNVTLDFDFSQTTSDGTLVRFGVNLLDGSPATTVEAADGHLVSVEFSDHGLHEIALFALDDKAQQMITTITVRIEWSINWYESNTYDPIPMTLDTVPSNEGIPPAAIIIESNVINPLLLDNIGGGRDVEVTWELIDALDLACQQQQGRVSDGETITWNTVHFNTYEVHELDVTYDDGQDYIDIEHNLFIQYESLETPPNL